MVITVNGEAREAAMSILTLSLYEQEFDGADMIADLNGKVRVNDEEEGVLFDYGRVPWEKIMQGAWAMLKTADPSTPHYQKWAAGVTQVNAFELRNVLSDLISDTFFHIAATPEEG